jgi:hypothetical protein
METGSPEAVEAGSPPIQRERVGLLLAGVRRFRFAKAFN